MPIYRRRLSWMDVDYARVAHYLRYYVWVDEAFHGDLTDRGFDLKGFIDEGYGLPYITTSCRYLRRLTLDDTVEIDATVEKLEEKGFTLRFMITKAGDPGPAAEGEMVRRCIRLDPPKSAPLPAALKSILDEMAAAKSP